MCLRQIRENGVPIREIGPTYGPWAGYPGGKHLTRHASLRHTENMTEPLEPSASEQGAYAQKPKPAVQCSMRSSPPSDFVHYASHVQHVSCHESLHDPDTTSVERSQSSGHVRRQCPSLASAASPTKNCFSSKISQELRPLRAHPVNCNIGRIPRAAVAASTTGSSNMCCNSSSLARAVTAAGSTQSCDNSGFDQA